MSRTFDYATGQWILEEPAPRFHGLNDTPAAAPISAPAIASFLGVPVTWVVIAGLGLILFACFVRAR